VVEKIFITIAMSYCKVSEAPHIMFRKKPNLLNPGMIRGKGGAKAFDDSSKLIEYFHHAWLTTITNMAVIQG
jgi:hypothetical protein